MTDVFWEILQYFPKYFSMINIWDVIDMLIVTVLVYKLFQLLRNSAAFRVLKVVLILLAVMWIAELLNLRVVNFLINSTLQVGLLAIIILFRPEIRRMLEQMGSSSVGRYFLGRESVGDTEYVIMQTVAACKALSQSKDGALIVFEHNVPLSDIVKTGTMLNALVTGELLRNIFYPKAPLHDGAVIIQNDKISGAGCMLPLTNNQNLSKDLGMRHRAGIGMSENSDAIVVIVSEETGTISVAQDGVIKRPLTPETLEKLLRSRLMPNDASNKRKGLSRVVGQLKRRGDDDA